MVDFKQKRYQFDRFILFYSLPSDNDFNYNVFLKSFRRRKGLGFSLYSSKFSLDELLKDTRNAALESNRVYYFISMSFAKRQNLFVDTLLNTVVTPTYLHMSYNNESCIPILCYPNSKYPLDNISGINKLERIFLSDDDRVICLEDQPIQNIESVSIARDSFSNENQFLYDSFMDQIVNFDSKKEVFEFISKPENKSLLFRADEILNKFNAILEFRNTASEQYQKPLNKEPFVEPSKNLVKEKPSLQEDASSIDDDPFFSNDNNLFSSEKSGVSQDKIDSILTSALKSPDSTLAYENPVFMNSIFMRENKSYIVSVLNSFNTDTQAVRKYSALHKVLYNYFIKRKNFTPSRKDKFKGFLPLIYPHLPQAIQDELKELI